MRISTKCRYGMRALVVIAGAYGKGPVKRKDIARQQEVSEGYLENLFVPLIAHGLLSTTRGSRGGYRLTRDPKEVSLLDVFQILEGPVTPVACLIDDACCKKMRCCVTRGVWDRIRRAIEEVLSDTTLQDLVKKGDRKIKTVKNRKNAVNHS